MDERQLGFFVSRLNISIEAHAFSSSRPLSDHEASKDNFSPQNMDVIWSSKVNTDEEPVIVVQQNDSQDENPYVYIVWKMLAYLSRLVLPHFE